MAQAPTTNGKIPPVVLPLHFSTEEASLILNKLNTADFKGFGEATLALSILGKIQSAPRIPAPSVGPAPDEMNRPPVAKEEVNNILDPPKFKPAPNVPTPPVPRTATPNHSTVSKDPELSKKEVEKETKPEPVQSAIKEETSIDAPDVPKEVLSESVEEDTRPTAPMTSLDQIRANKSKEVAEESPPPDEDAGIFSVIDRSTKVGKTAEEDYV